MDFIRKHWLYLFGGLLLFVYLFTRIYNILGLPIFTDEAIYVRWAQIAGNDAAWRFISLTDGKQPMLIWIAMTLMEVIDDPLLASRLVSVLAGLLSMIGIFFLTKELFKKKAMALLASTLYVLYPFSLVYDRLALYDSLVAMFIIWALYFEVLLVRHLRLDLALLLGMIIGGGMLTKTNASFALILLPFSLLLFNFKDKKWKKKLLKWVMLVAVSAIVTGVIYSVLRLSPFYHIIEEKNFVFIYPLQEWILHPFTYFSNNFFALSEWLIGYITLPFFLLVLAAVFIGKKFIREHLLLIAWFIVPLIALAVFGRLIYPRFILFMTMPLLVLGAYSLYSMMTYVKRGWMKALLFVVFTGMFFVKDYFIITDFPKAQIPLPDRDQFVAGWPAGGGVRETIAILEEKAKKGKIYVGTEGTFGLMPYALEIYLHDNPNITIKGFWPIGDIPPKEVTEASKKMPTYFVFYQGCLSCRYVGEAPLSWPVTKIFQIEKEQSDRFHTLYQINP